MTTGIRATKEEKQILAEQLEKILMNSLNGYDNTLKTDRDFATIQKAIYLLIK